MEEKPLRAKLIDGLQALYTKLTGKSINKEPEKEEVKGEETKEIVDIPQPLQELFLKRQKEWKEKRIKANADNAFLKIPRVVMLKYLLPYFEVREVCKLCEVCVCFNSLVKSTIFLHYYVSLHEKTGIAINLFTDPPKKIAKSAVPEEDEKSAQEDTEVQREMLQKTREFLSARLKESREQVKQLKNDIHTLRAAVEAEKGVKEKALAKAEQLENKILECKRESHSMVINAENNASDLEKEVIVLSLFIDQK